MQKKSFATSNVKKRRSLGRLRTSTALFLTFLTFLSVDVFATAQETQNKEDAQAVSNASPTAESDVASDDPNDPSANPESLAGVEAYLNGDSERAYQLFKGVYDANLDSDPPGVFLALLHSRAKKYPEMRRSLEQTAEDYPTDPEAFLQLAGIDIRENRLLEADLLLERAERLNDEYAKRFPNSPSRLAYLREESTSERANLAEKRGRFDVATAFVQKIVDANPKNAQAFWNLGYLAIKRNKLDEAEKAFDRAAELEPENWAGWLQVASALDRDDRADEALERLRDRADAVAKASKTERAQLARLYMRWNLIADATKIVESFEKDGNENDLDRWILLGWLALYANKYAIAEENFRNATLIDGANFEASNGLALALLDQSDKEKLAQARVVAAKNFRNYPDSQEAAATYGWTMFLSGNAKEANAVFGPMLDSGNVTATIAYYIAEIANVRGDRSLALNLLDLALKQKSNFPKRAAAVELREMLDPQEKEDAVGKDFDFGDLKIFEDDAETPQNRQNAAVPGTEEKKEAASDGEK